MTQQTHQKTGYTVLLWVIIFFAAMGGAAWFAFTFELDGFWSAVPMLIAMLFLIPLVRSAQKSAHAAGDMTPAMRRYNRRFVTFSFAYVATLLACVGLYNRFDIGGPALWVVALVPAMPVVGMVWTMARLLIEEDDEYQRQRVVNSALIGTGITLIVCTVWGFLETFGLVPNIWMWAVFPVWATSWGVGQIIARGRK